MEYIALDMNSEEIERQINYYDVVLHIYETRYERGTFFYGFFCGKIQLVSECFTKEGLDQLIELMKDCTELGKTDIMKLIEESNLELIEN
jgi:hypothetical protein